jgi:hypothetical protein
VKGRVWDFFGTGQLTYLYLSQTSPLYENAHTDSTVGYGAAVTIGHGTSETFRQELEGSFFRNDLRQAGRTVLPEAPDLGTSASGIATEDRAHARATLRKNWQGAMVAAWGEWNRVVSEGDPLLQAGVQTTQTLATAQALYSWFGLTGNVGRAESIQISKQEVSFLGGSLQVRPAVWLNLQMSYRRDRRILIDAPSIDGDRAEGALRFRIGEFVLSGTAFQYRDVDQATGRKTTNQGFYWTLSRDFGGWLPFISAPVRRGVVR